MIRVIAAMDKKRGIAKHGSVPWHLPEDMANFKQLTKSHGGRMLVGTTTFMNALKRKPLEGRTTYVLTRKPQAVEGVQLVHDLESWLKSMGGQDIWIIGGASIYKQIIDNGLADELYLTHIDADFSCDQFFPDYQASFQLVSQTKPKEYHGLHYNFAVYTKL